MTENNSKAYNYTYNLVLMAVFIAMHVILSRFLSIAAWNMKFGFAFVPIALAAMLLGPMQAGLVAGLADIIGAILFPIGAYFPGFTITAALTGVIYGMFFHKTPNTINIILGCTLVTLVCSLGLNTWWISILYGTPYMVLLPTRVFQALVMYVLHIVEIRALALYRPLLERAHAV